MTDETAAPARDETARGQLLLALELIAGIRNFVVTGGTNAPDVWAAQLDELKLLIDNALADA